MLTKPQVIIPTIFSDFPNVVAGFSTRQGGVSPAPFYSLNLGYSTDDDSSNVTANRERLLASIGLSDDQLAVAFQVHGADVRIVEEPGGYPACDGLVTGRRGVVLGILAADCAAILLVDIKAGIYGACHAGWRGAASGIVRNTVESMERLGASARQIFCYIGPCISQKNFEIGPEVAEKFSPEFLIESTEANDRFFLDLRGAIKKQLLESDIQYNHIETSSDCTFSATNRFFSHRAENGKTGRMMGFIALRPGA